MRSIEGVAKQVAIVVVVFVRVCAIAHDNNNNKIEKQQQWLKVNRVIL